MVGGSKSVRGRKKRRNAMNHAPRNPVTATHTRRRRRSLIWLGSGPTVANPAEAAAFDGPTAGVPTYRVASPPPAADVFVASGFGLPASVSGPAIRYLLDQVLCELCISRRQTLIRAVRAQHRKTRHQKKSEKCGGKISRSSAVTQKSHGVGVERAGREHIRCERQGPVGLEKCHTKALRGPQHSLDPPETKRILLKTNFFVNA